MVTVQVPRKSQWHRRIVTRIESDVVIREFHAYFMHKHRGFYCLAELAGEFCVMLEGLWVDVFRMAEVGARLDQMLAVGSSPE